MIDDDTQGPWTYMVIYAVFRNEFYLFLRRERNLVTLCLLLFMTHIHLIHHYYK